MEYIIGYYFFTLQQYLLHKIQHGNRYYKKHVIAHHGSYNRNDITKIVNKNSLIHNLDMYFYGNIICFLFNIGIFHFNVVLFQMFIGYLSYYFHNEYHNPKSIWSGYRLFEYLKKKHTIHHLVPNKNHFLLDPTFDIIFRSYL